MTPLAYSYIRFSSPRQAAGDSLARQTEAAREWCRANGAKLDEATTLHDLGRSAFTGEHRKNPDRAALAAFLRLVEDGRVPRGSFLVVESLDRLSREHIRPALSLILSLIDAGVRVVQLRPTVAVYGEDVDPMQLMMAIMELSRGHSESAVKSARCRSAWAKKKDKARAERTPLSANLPRWLELRDGRIVPVPERVEIVRRIFDLAIAGHGLRGIAVRLTADGVKSFGGRRAEWTRSYVGLILTDRRVLGEHTFNARNDRGQYRRDAADRLPGYYPAVVSEATFAAAGRALASRHRTVGRRGRHVNIFSGLLRQAGDNSPYHLTRWKIGGGWASALIPFSGTEGHGPTRGFRYDPLEAAVLDRIREIDPAEVVGKTGPDPVALLAAEVAALEANVRALEKELDAGDDIPAVVRVLRRKEDRLRAAREELASARADAATPAGEAVTELHSLAAALTAVDDPDEVRVKIRAALRRAVSAATMLVVPRTPNRLACVQFDFTTGLRRTWVVAYFPAARPSGRLVREASWTCISSPGLDDLDLRQSADAAEVEKLLNALDYSRLST